MLSDDDKFRMPVSLDRVDPAYVEALIALEDERFFSHPGVDPIAIGRAALSNMTHGRVVSGGSTITMQLVRLLEPRPRTFGSKVVEAFRAVQLELHMSKEEILEGYLQFVPYGRNVEGVESASIAYFGQTANVMSEGQIATLLAVPQAPTSRYPTEQNAERLEEGRRDVAEKLFREGALIEPVGEGEFTLEQALAQIAAEPVPQRLRALPRRVPHLAHWFRSKHPDRVRFETTLDRNLQDEVEQLVAARKAEAGRHGVYNAAVVLTEHETGAIRALAGNFDFSMHRPGAHIPAFDVVRSSGSLLKPFLYAEAIDRGKAAPGQLVPDVPATYGMYNPQNYGYSYSGLVRMEEALAQSLNVPFVQLLSRVGVERFTSTIRQLGLQRFNPAPGEQGLSLAVGGVEATPVEIASLYAALAQDGRRTPVSVLPEELAILDETPVLGDGALWLTRQALRRRDRPDAPGGHHGLGARHDPSLGTPIHWKTGTSHGHRDAWAAGSGGRYTAVVWMGNMSNTPSTYLVGARAAAPLFFDILEAVDDAGVEDPRPEDAFADVEVCAFSGHLPTEACGHTDTVELPAHAVPTERCPYHVRVDVDKETGHALGARCRQGRDFETRSFVELPPGVRRWMQERLGGYAEPPALHPECDGAAGDRPPAIASPPAGETLVLMDGIPTEHQKVALEADAVASNENLSWFVDGHFLGRAKPHEPLWWEPTRGEHEVVVQNAAGRSTKRRLVVQ